MELEVEYKKPERTTLCEISLDTCIYDEDLPAKILKKLSEVTFEPMADKVYSLDVSFDIRAYNHEAFYRFPVERKEWQKKAFEKMDARQKRQQLISDVLSQQLDNICAAIAPLQINYRYAAIAGEDFDEENHVDFWIYEEPSQSDEEKPSGSKKKKKSTQYHVSSIIPYRPGLVKRMAKVLAELSISHAQAEMVKESRKAAHTPNWISAANVFSALASAVLSECPDLQLSPDALASEMMAQTQLNNDWPLEITGTRNTRSNENNVRPDDELDCSEYLIFVKHEKRWTLKSINGLDDAKHTILFHGYNQKSVELVVVLHNLQPVPFHLFAENNGEITPIEKKNAHMHKKRLLSWENK